jgi:hypothetical protein
MCYTQKDSIISYGVGTLTSMLLFFAAGKKHPSYQLLAVFFFFVAQMQLFDFLFWTYPECNAINRVTTKTAIVFNHAQPLVHYGLHSYFGIEPSGLSTLAIILYSLIAIPYTFSSLRDVECTREKDGIIHWEWNYRDLAFLMYGLFILYLVVASFHFKTSSLQYTAVLAIFVSYLLAMKKQPLNASIGRAWCYYANAAPLLFLGLLYLNP